LLGNKNDPVIKSMVELFDQRKMIATSSSVTIITGIPLSANIPQASKNTYPLALFTVVALRSNSNLA
jgi:hypothetical protein